VNRYEKQANAHSGYFINNYTGRVISPYFRNNICRPNANQSYDNSNYYGEERLIASRPGQIPANAAGYSSNCACTFAYITNAKAG
jgi:hypothetical protein